MKHVLLSLKDGGVQVADVPCPVVSAGAVLIRSEASLISAGTERMLIEFGRSSLFKMAREHPERVRQVVDKFRTDGLACTLEAVLRRLDEPIALGYCNAGVVVEAGAGVDGLRPGDRVVSNGPHSEFGCVGKHLCAKIPGEVPSEQACFAPLGAIALQGLRLAQPTFGEKFVVSGTGLVGLLAVQLLRAHGCDVLAVDLRDDRLELAGRFGARTVNAATADPVAAVQSWTGGRGADGVIIAAAAKQDRILHQAAAACRKRARIILIGIAELNLRRDDFYEKELQFQVSCSYGPGRYDAAYENGSHDYPYAYVRWTEQRNFDAILGALKTGKLQVADLITHRFAFADIEKAYEKLAQDNGSLGILLRYPDQADPTPTVRVTQTAVARSGDLRIGLIGAGAFAQKTLLPILSRSQAHLAIVASRSPLRAHHGAKKFGVAEATGDPHAVIQDPEIDAVFIAVEPYLHPSLVVEALEAGKHVFVEKPLALNEEQLTMIEHAVLSRPDRLLMVGYNRRFSRHCVRIRALLSQRHEPLSMSMTVNAGVVSPGHWLHDPRRGGGRIIGECCHFVDLLSFIARSPISSVSAVKTGGSESSQDDSFSIALTFQDGSTGVINYFVNGSKRYPKERLEIFSEGRVLSLENFLVLRGYGFKGFTKLKTPRQDKGHRAELLAFIERLRAGGEPLIPFDELRNVTLATIAAVKAAEEHRVIDL